MIWEQGTVILQVLPPVSKEKVQEMTIDENIEYTSNYMKEEMRKMNDIATPEFCATKTWKPVFF